MALTRAKKTEKVSKLAGELEARPRAIIGTFKADRVQGLRAAQDRSRGWRQLPRRQEQAGRTRRQGHQDRSRAAGPQGCFVRRLHLGRPGRAGQGALDLGQGQRGVHLQAGHRRRQGHQRRRDQAARHHAGQGRALLEAPLPDQSPGAASGHGHQRHRPRPGRRHQPGRREGQVCRCGRAGSSRLRKRRSAGSSGCRSRCRSCSSRAFGAEAAASKSRRTRLSQRPASSLPAQRSRRTPPHRRLGKLRRPSPSKVSRE